jgi:hypothetical protein
MWATAKVVVVNSTSKLTTGLDHIVVCADRKGDVRGARRQGQAG